MKSNELSIEVDRETLLKILQQSTHTGMILQRDYSQGKDKFRESLAVEGLSAGRNKLTIRREQLAEEKPEGIVGGSN